ncbi:MAG TPA: helix-turn-helix domain-containing protein [Burkholderiales bacterium]|nr:helix-turn-helix domain-containing protein [Burkholderiales bacterium]
MITEVDTAIVESGERIGFWQESLATLTHAEQKIKTPAGASFNAKLRLYELERLRFAVVSGTPHTNVSLPNAQNDVFVLIVPIEGLAAVKQDGREARFDPGVFGFCSLGRPYTIDADSEFRRVLIHVPGRELREIFPACNYITATAISMENAAGTLFRDMVHSLSRNIEKIEQCKTAAMAAADTCMNLLRGMLHELPEARDNGPSRLEFYHKERIRNHVKTNLRSSLSVESIARAVELSPRYVHSLFSNEPVSLMKWVWTERLDRCRHDLGLASLSSRSVSEIAYTWGFNDPAHFSRTFRSHFGTSPTKYRQQALQPFQPSSPSPPDTALPVQTGQEPLAA